MDFKIENRGEYIVISGQIDSVNSAEFDNQINNSFELIQGSITLDCANLEYISSSGLRVFIALQKRCNSASRNMTVTNLQPHIKEIFDMTGFSKIITIQ